MAFCVVMTDDAKRQFGSFSAREQRILEIAIESRLLHQPTIPTKAIKRLRPNPVADFELRVGDLRVLYNVSMAEVLIVLFARKRGNNLLVEGKEYDKHEDDLAEPSGNGVDAHPE